jgi:inorganic pyrophosphatase
MLTDARQFLGKTVTVLMDRPLGSKHPKYGYRYLVNYGFIENTLAPDGQEVDAYALGIEGPVEEFTGTCIALIHRFKDEDDKVVVVPEGVTMTDEEIRQAVHFQEQYFESEIIR